MAAKYAEIADDLRKLIHSGAYVAGTTLPTYETLSQRYVVGRGVIQRAIRTLEEEGLVVSVKRRGLVVRDRGQRRRVTRGHTVTRHPARGYVMPAAATPDEPWQVHGQPRVSRELPPERVTELLNVPGDTPVLCRRRVTSPAGEPPFQLVTSWIHPTAETDAPRVAAKDTGHGGYLDRIEESGHAPLSWTEYLRVRMPHQPSETRALDMPAAMPVMEIARVGTSPKTKTPIEVTIVIIPADRVEIETKLRRT